MAIPVPPPFISLPSFSQDRGPIRFDPTTKSSKNKPSGYAVNDICGGDAYRRGGIAVSVNALVDCQPVQVASISISATFAVGTTAANMKTAITALGNELADSLAAIE